MACYLIGGEGCRQPRSIQMAMDEWWRILSELCLQHDDGGEHQVGVGRDYLEEQGDS
jgi:hypothetical protein